VVAVPVLAFPYPVRLTNAHWQKKKSLPAKNTKTGVGETLVALQKAFNQAPFGKFDPNVLAAETLDPVAFDRKTQGLKQSFAGAARALKPQIAASDLAINKAIPVFAKGSNQDLRKHLEQMRQDLKQFGTDLDGYGDTLVAQAGAAYRVRLHSSSYYVALTNAAKTGDANIKALLSMIKKVQAAGTIASINDVFGDDGPHRILTTTCQMWDQLVVRDAPAFVKAVKGPTSAMTTVAGMDWLMDVANEMNSDATKRVQLLANQSSEEDAVQQFAQEYTTNVNKARPFVNIVIKAGTALSQF
jgi:hypothetical protein